MVSRKLKPTDTIGFQLRSGNPAESFATFATLLRGLIVERYSQVEFFIIDLLCRCWPIDDYRHIVGEKGPPYRLEKRLNMLKKIYLVEGGRLRSYASRAIPLIDELLTYEPLRHMMVHGCMTYEFKVEDPPASTVNYQRYDFLEGRLVRYEVTYTSLQLQAAERQVSQYSNEFLLFISNMIQEASLERPHATPLQERNPAAGKAT